jgi:ABC-type Fe3+-hydroxamate transport system substrate-binding protein
VVASDTAGRKVALDGPATRIVSLSPGATEILFAIGAGGRIIARGPGCDFPEGSLRLPLASEAIGAPDLVIVDGLDVPNGFDGPRDRPYPVYVHHPATFLELARSMMALGRLVGMENEGIVAAARLTGATARVRSITEKIGSSRFPRVFWAASADPLATCGADSLAHDLIAIAGGKDIFSDRDVGRTEVALPEIIQRGPEAIIAVGSGGGAEETILSLEGNKGRSLLIAPGLADRAGPRSASALLIVARFLHPGMIP